MVKLDDVAKLAGVSKGTASRVLNNRGYISQQTRERIGPLSRSSTTTPTRMRATCSSAAPA